MERFILRVLTFTDLVRKGRKLLRITSQKLTMRLIFKTIGSYESSLSGRVIVATKNGLYLLVGGKVVLIFAGEFYGITKYGSQVYVFEKCKSEGRVITFPISIKNQKFEVSVKGLSPGCHQIDFLGNKLFVTDTYNNRILIYNLKGEKLNEFYPIGKLENGRKSKNYGHINSIYNKDEFIYLVCHNETKKTGRKSELLKVSRRNFKLIDRKSINASSAHNCIILENNSYLVCDSLNNRVIKDDKSVFQTNKFTRGLSISEKKILIGGSDYAKRGERKNADGQVNILSINFELIETIPVPGMVQEIRHIDTPDLSLSNHIRAQNFDV